MTTDQPKASWLLLLCAIGIGSLIAVAVFVRAFQHPLDHDEHQFVASAALIAREGLVPYRDFPYFHLPYLSYLYAAVFLVSDRLLLCARGVSTLAALATVLVVAVRAQRALPSLPPAARIGLAGLFSAALVTNPIFMYAAGRAWNHDFAIFLAIVATLRTATAGQAARPTTAAFAGGLLLGLACGVRSTMAALVPALAITLWLVNRDPRPHRFIPRLLLAYFAGGVVGLLPVLVLFALAPEQFLHGNLSYNITLNPLYRLRLGHGVAMTMDEKIAYLFDFVLSHPRAVALVAAYGGTGLAAVMTRNPSRSPAVAIAIALCLPALLLAALAPTPTWYQYYYATQVFLLVGVLAHLSLAASWTRALAILAVLPMLAGAITGLRWHWPFVATTVAFDTSTVERLHVAGERISALTPTGRVLTLGPIYPLEGGAKIYPALATGPFQWRTADLVSPDEHDRLGLLGPADLPALKERPDLGGILTGVERDPAENLEETLLELVDAEGWTPQQLDDGLVLWLPPPP